MIKLLIVDDSALMRRQLTQLFSEQGDFEIRQARTGSEAVQQNREFLPDVITLDINMPDMDGITALSIMMVERPVPVVMVSSLTAKGALATFEALNLGALDYVAKPGGTISLSIDLVRRELVDKVRAAAQVRLGRKGQPLTAPSRSPLAPAPARPATVARPLRRTAAATPAGAGAAGPGPGPGPGAGGVVLIGVSTGGPRALEQVLPTLPADFPWPVLVAQHMPGSFTGPFAARLDALCAVTVVEVARPMALEPGTVYIGRGSADLVLARRAGALHAVPRPEAPDQLWHPSVQLLGQSALEYVPPQQLIAVMLTGMGDDGAAAFAEIRQRGGRTIAESEQSAVVYGMPGALVALGGASLVLGLEEISKQLRGWAALA